MVNLICLVCRFLTEGEAALCKTHDVVVVSETCPEINQIARFYGPHRGTGYEQSYVKTLH